MFVLSLPTCFGSSGSALSSGNAALTDFRAAKCLNMISENIFLGTAACMTHPTKIVKEDAHMFLAKIKYDWLSPRIRIFRCLLFFN